MDADCLERVLTRRFHLARAPSVVATALAPAPIAFSRLRSGAREPVRTGPVVGEEGYTLQIILAPIGAWSLRAAGRTTALPPVGAGDVCPFDLADGPRLDLDPPFDMLRVYIARAALDGGRPRLPLDEPRADPVLHHMALALADALARPHETAPLYIEHMALAVLAHVGRRFGDGPARPRAARGLASWQWRRVTEAMRADLSARHSAVELAAACRLSPAHFMRAFRQSCGLAPHQWLTRVRVERARSLLADPRLPLTDIAATCGFCDHSHFSRVFARLTGQTPTAWRRRTLAAPPADD